MSTLERHLMFVQEAEPDDTPPGRSLFLAPGLTAGWQTHTMALLDKFRSILQIRDTPHRIAMAFASGVFWGISPFLGLHTITAFGFAWIFRLNRLVAIVGVYVTNPWTIVPIYSFCIWIGAKMTGMQRILPDIDWAEITFLSFLDKLKILFWPFFIGTFTVAAVSSVVSYLIVYWVVVRYRKIQDDA